MRARYSAFAAGQEQYLRSTWHPRTRPKQIGLDQGIRWNRLAIEQTTAGGPQDEHGLVKFAAYYWDADGRPGVLREGSTFCREAGQWFYLVGRSW